VEVLRVDGGAHCLCGHQAGAAVLSETTPWVNLVARWNTSNAALFGLTCVQEGD